MKTYKISPFLILSVMLLFATMIFLLAGGMCYLAGAYSLRKFTDMIFAFGWAFFGIGIGTWGGRVLRFYHQTNSFRDYSFLDGYDRQHFTPSQRRWVLVFFANRPFISLVLSGILMILVAVIFGDLLVHVFPVFPVNMTIRFLVRPDLLPLVEEVQPVY